MLFNSFLFIFGFLPIALVLTYATGRWTNVAKAVLTLASLGFYAWWKPIHLPLLLGSIVFNYVVGDRIQRAKEAERDKVVKIWLALGLIVDLGLLGWFKYAGFVADNVAGLFGAESPLPRIILPLAISFFTFQKIAYLIDSARGEAKKMSFLDFALFAAFFPQLIAGPIVHYKEVVPQFQTRGFARINWRNILIGLVIFAIGLFKKTVIADTLASYANPMFTDAAAGGDFTFAAGWLAAITYTCQLYFDFSGYSDMAIGLARMFGIKLPLNFHSPLRASNIADYWRRWHMTLQRFIVAYMFQPLSVPMNRWAAERGLQGWWAFGAGVALPTFLTFMVIGIWHGAGWTFVTFGLMHAIYICINEAWNEFRKRRRKKMKKLGRPLREPGLAGIVVFHTITLIAVMYANVVFRADSLPTAVSVWHGMTGMNGLGLEVLAAFDWGLWTSLVVAITLIFAAPNTQQIMAPYDPAFNWKDWKTVGIAPIQWTWKPNSAGLMFAGVALFLAIIFIQRGKAVFLYFNF